MKNLKTKNNYILLLFLFLAVIPAIFPLLHKGFFVSDDGEWMIIRFSAFHQAVVHGEFPVRWLGRLNMEYGYPVANFLYPGFMYLGEFIHIAGFNFIATLKMIFGLSIISSVLFTYLWLSRLFSKFSSIIGALIYVYLPYHLYDVYVRGSVGEILALTFFPFILWSVEMNNTLLAGLGIGALILSHNTLALLFLPIVFLYILIRRYIHFSLFSPFLIGFGISAFFWIPALYDLQYTVFTTTKVSEWQHYFSTFQEIGYIPFIVIVCITLLLLFQYIFKKTKKVKVPDSMKKYLLLFYIISIASLFFATIPSKIYWNILPISFIQFPFRFLSITLIAITFLSTYFLDIVKREYRYLSIVILFVLLFTSFFPILTHIQYTDKGNSFYATNEDTTTVKNEYMPKWVIIYPTERPSQKVETTTGFIQNIQQSSNVITFIINTQKPAKVTINTIYFPGWRIEVNGKEIPIFYNNERGVMQFFVHEGIQKVRADFFETFPRFIADMISLFTILTVLFWFIKRNIFLYHKV